MFALLVSRKREMDDKAKTFTVLLYTKFEVIEKQLLETGVKVLDVRDKAVLVECPESLINKVRMLEFVHRVVEEKHTFTDSTGKRAAIVTPYEGPPFPKVALGDIEERMNKLNMERPLWELVFAMRDVMAISEQTYHATEITESIENATRELNNKFGRPDMIQRALVLRLVAKMKEGTLDKYIEEFNIQHKGLGTLWNALTLDGLELISQLNGLLNMDYVVEYMKLLKRVASEHIVEDID